MTTKVQERTDHNPCAKVEVCLITQMWHLVTLNILNPTPCNLLFLSIIWSPYLGKKGHFFFFLFAVTSEYSSAKSKVACVPLLLLFLHNRHKQQSPSTIQWLILFDNFARYMIKHKLLHFNNKLMQHQREELAISQVISHLNRQKQHVDCFYILLHCSLTESLGFALQCLKMQIFILIRQRFKTLMFLRKW